MEMNRTTLGQRISMTLRTKQYLVFFAIGLYSIDEAAALFVAWLREERPVAEILAASGSLIGDLLAAPSAAGIVVVAAYLAGMAWLRAGYIRSIVGGLHLAPQGAAQWVNMLGLLLIARGLQAALAFGLSAAGESQLWSSPAFLGILGVNFALLYADYAIIISSLHPPRAIGRSLRVAVGRAFVSLLVLLSITLAGNVTGFVLQDLLTGSFADLLPLLVIRVLVLGSVSFVADVALILTYIEAVESGDLPYGRRAR